MRSTESQESSLISLSLLLPALQGCLGLVNCTPKPLCQSLNLPSSLPPFHLELLPSVTQTPEQVALWSLSSHLCSLLWSFFLYTAVITNQNISFVSLKFPLTPSSFGIKSQPVKFTCTDLLARVVINTLYLSTSCPQLVQLSPFLMPLNILVFLLL